MSNPSYKKIKIFFKNLLLISFIFWGSYFVYKHEIRKMVLFRIPGDYTDIGCGVLVSDVCIFNPLRDRTLERTVQRMIDYLHEKDPEKAGQILEELKKNPIVSSKVIKRLQAYRKKRPDLCVDLGRLKPIDYFKKKGKIIFAFWVKYCKESPYYGKFQHNVAAGGYIKIDPKTGKIVSFVMIS